MKTPRFAVLLLLIGALGCTTSGQLPSTFDDNDDATGDDDDATGDDDDVTGDDDDSAGDDDDSTAGDDDDATGDDDDATGDDDDSTTVPVDADGDGYDSAADCDDADPSVNPGASEACDGVDQDCDGAYDEGGVCTGCTQAEFAGHTYQFCDPNAGKTWPQARDECVAWGYALATIETEAEDEWVIDEADNDSEGWWIGLNDRGGGNEGNFTWVATGAAPTYTNWDQGEPNNDGNEDCVEFSQWSDDEWNDFACNYPQFWVCEGDFPTP